MPNDVPVAVAAGVKEKPAKIPGTSRSAVRRAKRDKAKKKMIAAAAQAVSDPILGIPGPKSGSQASGLKQDSSRLSVVEAPVRDGHLQEGGRHEDENPAAVSGAGLGFRPDPVSEGDEAEPVRVLRFRLPPRALEKFEEDYGITVNGKMNSAYSDLYAEAQLGVEAMLRHEPDHTIGFSHPSVQSCSGIRGGLYEDGLPPTTTLPETVAVMTLGARVDRKALCRMFVEGANTIYTWLPMALGNHVLKYPVENGELRLPGLSIPLNTDLDVCGAWWCRLNVFDFSKREITSEVLDTSRWGKVVRHRITGRSLLGIRTAFSDYEEVVEPRRYTPGKPVTLAKTIVKGNRGLLWDTEDKSFEYCPELVTEAERRAGTREITPVLFRSIVNSVGQVASDMALPADNKGSIVEHSVELGITRGLKARRDRYQKLMCKHFQRGYAGWFEGDAHKIGRLTGNWENVINFRPLLLGLSVLAFLYSKPKMFGIDTHAILRSYLRPYLKPFFRLKRILSWRRLRMLFTSFTPRIGTSTANSITQSIQKALVVTDANRIELSETDKGLLKAIGQDPEQPQSEITMGSAIVGMIAAAPLIEETGKRMAAMVIDHFLPSGVGSLLVGSAFGAYEALYVHNKVELPWRMAVHAAWTMLPFMDGLQRHALFNCLAAIGIKIPATGPTVVALKVLMMVESVVKLGGRMTRKALWSKSDNILWSVMAGPLLEEVVKDKRTWTWAGHCDPLLPSTIFGLFELAMKVKAGEDFKDRLQVLLFHMAISSMPLGVRWALHAGWNLAASLPGGGEKLGLVTQTDVLCLGGIPPGGMMDSCRGMDVFDIERCDEAWGDLDLSQPMDCKPGPPIVPVGFHNPNYPPMCFRLCWHNEAAGIATRVLRKTPARRDELTYTPGEPGLLILEFWQEAGYEFLIKWRRQIRQMRGQDSTRTGWNTWIKHFKPSRQFLYNLYRDYQGIQGVTRRERVRKAFVKKELACKNSHACPDPKLGDPRLIQGAEEEWSVRTALELHACTKLFSHIFHCRELFFYVSGSDCEAVGQWLCWAGTVVKGKLVMITIDAKRFDSSVTPPALSHHHDVLEVLGVPVDKVDELRQREGTNHGRTANGIRYTFEGEVSSGHGDTSLCDSVISISIMSKVADERPLSPPNMVRGDEPMETTSSPQLVAAVNGDDNTVVTTMDWLEDYGGQDALKRTYERAGFDITIIINDWPFGDFCSSLYWPVTDECGFVLGNKIGRTLGKTFYDCCSRPADSYARTVAVGLVNTCAHVPVLRAVVETTLRLTAGSKLLKDTQGHEKLRASSRHECDEHRAAELIWYRYGLHWDDVVELETQIRAARALPFALKDPRFDKLCAVDWELPT